MDEQIRRLAQLDIKNILLEGDPHFNLGQLEKNLELLKIGAQKLIEYPDYWNELPKPAQNLIIQETATLMRVIDEIAGTKENTNWLTSNLGSRKDSLSHLYNTLYPFYVSGIRQYENGTDKAREQVKKLITEIKSTKRLAVQETEEVSNAASRAQEAAGVTATSNLAQHFDLVANGDPDNKIKNKEQYKFTWHLRALFDDSYKMAAVRWLIGVILSTVATAMLAYSVLHDLTTVDNLETLAAKALILAAPAYGIKFCARNYRDSKALQSANNHRAVVMKTLLAFLDRSGIDEPTRNLIITEAATQAFRQDNQTLTGSSDSENVLEIPTVRMK